MGTQVSHPYSWRDTYRGMSSDNIKGLVLALSSSVFIGASFIIKKKGLKKSAVSGVRAGLFLTPHFFIPLLKYTVSVTFMFISFFFPDYSFIQILFCMSLLWMCCLFMCLNQVDLILFSTFINLGGTKYTFLRNKKMIPNPNLQITSFNWVGI